MAENKPTRAIHFATDQDFRSWLAHNHDKVGELWIAFYKKSAEKQGTSYAEALDQALCYGWIDGVRHAIDVQSYKIRFTRRRPKSVWSLINVRRVERLKELGKMEEPGLQAYEARQQQRTGIYSFEQKRPGLTAKQEKTFRSNPAAWKFYSEQAPWYRRVTGHWVGSAKRAETQRRRLAQLIVDSAAGRRINRLNPKAKHR